MSAEFLSTLRASGIELWADDGKLRYRAPAGVMTAVLMGQLRAHKSELLASLESADIEAMTENAMEHFTERAAIAEFDGGLSRTEAERQAASRVFEVLLTCNEGQWFPLLMQPGDTLGDAKAWCIERFGPEKFISARPYRTGGTT